ncbi:MAG: class I SAM-dependent methyltransferase [Acidobacteriaceae bacterium]
MDLPSYLEHERSVRDQQAANYEGWIADYQHAAEWDRYSRIVNSWRGTVVDLGCGTGRFTRRLDRPDLEVIGVDFSRASLELARKAASWATFLEGDVRNVPLPDNSANHVLSIQVYEHLLHADDAQKFFSEVARLLKPEGTALISGYAYAVWDWLRGQKIFDRAPDVRFVRYSVSELRNFALRSGLELIRHGKAILFTRHPFNRIVRQLPEGHLVSSDRWLSPLLGSLWGSLTVLELRKR